MTNKFKIIFMGLIFSRSSRCPSEHLEERDYGKSGIYGNKANTYNPLQPNEAFELGFGPLVIGANAILTLGGIDIVNYKYERTLLDKQQLWLKD